MDQESTGSNGSQGSGGNNSLDEMILNELNDFKEIYPPIRRYIGSTGSSSSGSYLSGSTGSNGQSRSNSRHSHSSRSASQESSNSTSNEMKSSSSPSDSSGKMNSSNSGSSDENSPMSFESSSSGEENESAGQEAMETSPPRYYPSSNAQVVGKKKRIVMWFRRDLRLKDNSALNFLLQLDRTDLEIIPIYIIHTPVNKRSGNLRFKFLLESLADLQNSLRERGADLYVIRGEAVAVLDTLLRVWNVTHVFINELLEPHARERDLKVRDICMKIGVEMICFPDVTLYDMNFIRRLNGNRNPQTFSVLQSIIKELPLPRRPSDLRQYLFPPIVELDELVYRLKRYSINLWDTVTSGNTQDNTPFGIPDLGDFGYLEPNPHSFLYGGETVALSILDNFCQNPDQVKLFDKRKSSPAQRFPTSTTALSPYVTFGCLSVRDFFHRVNDLQNTFEKDPFGAPVTLGGQLIWREFFYCNAVTHVNDSFDSMYSNPDCRIIPWRLQEIPDNDHKPSEDEELAMYQFNCWVNGQTGFPWIDAAMRQIRTEGWAHHSARHSVAVFLTRGDLYISWERGMEAFQELLIDYDWSLNTGNWLWLSCSSFYDKYNQVYDPCDFGKLWDPEGDYIRAYVQELRRMPTKYIHKPWKAPLTVQKEIKCVLGRNYPFPILNHAYCSRKCMEKMKAIIEKSPVHTG